MDKREREKYKKLLIKEKIRILEAIGAFQKSSLESSWVEGGNPRGIPSHLAELASDNFEKNLDLDLASSEGKLLAKINDALAKLEKNLFGICEKCHKKIDKKRLHALPYARLCIACQKKEEGSGLHI